jgi:hypothetical protein
LGNSNVLRVFSFTELVSVLSMTNVIFQTYAQLYHPRWVREYGCGTVGV